MRIRNWVMFMLACTPTFATPVILNGSFENGIGLGGFTTINGGNAGLDDWTVTGHSIDYIGSYWVAQEGNRSVDLNGNGVGGVQQVVPGFTVNVPYYLYFYMSGNSDGPPPVKDLRVNVSGIGDFDFTFDSTGVTHSNMGWQLKALKFVATSTTHTITFSSTTSIPSTFYGPALDNVSIDEVPEPATMALMGVGMLALAAFKRRK